LRNFNLLGYSGHAYVVADALLSIGARINGYFDLKISNKNPYELHYLGDENSINEHQENSENTYFPAVGSNILRKKMVELIERKNLEQTNIIHASAVISDKAVITDKSIFIAANVVVNSLCHISKGCIINTGAIIEHECHIAEFTHIAPGAVLAGNVTIGSETFIGANTVVIQGKTIGNNVIIGAGSVVISDIPDNQTWVGNPAKRIK
jgi:sugar O-acyltransferase (sialic acid O-acetyltransferase NeuD family)